MIRKLFHWSIRLPFHFAALILLLWAMGALCYCFPAENAGLRGAAAMIFAGIFLGCWIFVRKWSKFIVLGVLIAGVMAWFGSISPNPATRYQTPWARMPEFTFDDNRITVRNVRDFRYRSENDYTVRYRTETYDLAKAKKLSLALSHWDGLQAIGHTMLCFEFDDGKFVAISTETRIPEGAEQGTIPGLYKQFGLGMIFGTESDLLKLRATYRGETVYLYPTTAPREAVALVFRRLAERAEALRQKPEFYNTLYANCTTTLVPPLLPILFDWKFDIRLLLNGTIDAMASEKGYLERRTDGDWDEEKNLCRLLAGIKEEGADYSRKIRTQQKR